MARRARRPTKEEKEEEEAIECGICCVKFVFVSFPLFWLTFWISNLASPTSPELSIVMLQLPALNASLSSSYTNTTTPPLLLQNTTLLNFQLKLDNPNFFLGIRYKNLSVSFYYPANESSTKTSTASVILDDFYQGFRKHAVKSGSCNASGVNWIEMATELAKEIKSEFEVKVKATIKFKASQSWVGKSQKLTYQGSVGIDKQGAYKSKKGVHLKGKGRSVWGRIFTRRRRK